jgi:D-arabinose 1-dehydrogenase-like Zn-dependent alcohol dehydrogenase
LKCVKWKARVVVVGFAAGTIEKIPANLILLKNISIVGVHWGAYTSESPLLTAVPHNMIDHRR